MFKTTLEFIENSYLVTVQLDGVYKIWAHPFFDDAVIHRSTMEHHYFSGELETLREKMA